MKIRIDNLPKVSKGMYDFYQYETADIWTDEYRHWFDNNAAEQIAQVHTIHNHVTFTQVVILEFKLAEDATIFLLQFAC